MKSKLILFVLIVLSVKTYSQSRNDISFIYGLSGNTVLTRSSLGDVGYDTGNSSIYGIDFSRTYGKWFSIETGLQYSYNKVKGQSFSSGTDINFNHEIKMISIPVIAKFSFLKFLYADAGITTDFVTIRLRYLINLASALSWVLGVDIIGGATLYSLILLYKNMQ
jgi:hypothetical protein